MLKKNCTFIRAFVTALMFFSLPLAFAVNGQQGYFVGVHGGLALPADGSDVVQDGYSVGGQYGYRLRNFRTAVTLDYISHDFESPAEGDYNLLNVMADFYYDFNYQGRFVPFIGAGIGYVNVSKDDCNGVTDCEQIGSGSQFAYQGLAGIGMQHDCFRFDVQYRYLSYDHSGDFADNVIEGVLNFFFEE